MKPVITHLAFGVLLGAAGSAHAAFNLAPDGDFSGGVASWGEASDGPTAFSYPASDGNPDGHARMNFTTGGFAVIFSGEVTAASLGLVPGDTYDFKIDMKRFGGAAGTIGGLKIEFPGATPDNTGDMRPTVIGSGSTWETYTFPVTVPANATTVKFVPLWGGPDTDIGYDNVGVEAEAVTVAPIPNSDFELPGGLFWAEGGGAETTWSYPTSGGNPGGHGVISNTGAGYGLWISNNNNPISLESLGLQAGKTYTFQQDMKILTGNRIGGLKVDFAPTGSTGDMFPDLIGDGTTWKTYSFEVAIPAGVTGIKLVPLWGKFPEDGQPNSVAYDNFRIQPPAPFMASISTGSVVSWTPNPEYPEDEYQPRRSFDGMTWEDVGPRIVGNTVSSAFDPLGAPFHQVDEYFVTPAPAIQNGGFEDPQSEDPLCPNLWTCVTNIAQAPTRITTDARTGTASIRIRVQNDATGTPNSSEIQQNVTNQGGFVIPGTTYDFSFWAKQVSSGTSYVQQFRVQWLDDQSGILPGGVGFDNFTGGDGVWKEIKVPGLVAPPNASTALIQIFGATGAVAGTDAEGEVLIDDVTMGTISSTFFEVIPANSAPGVSISWPTTPGASYQAKSSNTLENFTNFGDPVIGDGDIHSVFEPVSDPGKFYLVEETE